MKKFLLAEMAPQEVGEAFKTTDVVVIPTGSIHPHGAATPLGFEGILAEELAKRVAQRTDVLVVPALKYGYTEYHADFPGVISVRRSAFYYTLLDITTWLYKWGARKFVYIPTHGGDHPQIQQVAYRCRRKWNVLSAALSWFSIAKQLNPVIEKYQYGNGEGLTEDIAVMMYLRPDLVNVSAETFQKPKQRLGENFNVKGLWNTQYKGVSVELYLNNKDITDTGGYGPAKDRVDYTKESTPELGKQIVTTVVDYMVEFINEFRKAEAPTL